MSCDTGVNTAMASAAPAALDSPRRRPSRRVTLRRRSFFERVCSGRSFVFAVRSPGGETVFKREVRDERYSAL